MISTTSLQAKNFEQLAGAVRYYSWVSDAVSTWVGQRILDVGCGYGNVTKNFLNREFIFGIDIQEGYISHIRSRFADQGNFRAELLDVTHPSASRLLQQYGFDTTIAFNVFEHIADDLGAARAVYEILKPGGHIIVGVPAFKTLMSPYDITVGHYRRYTRRSAADMLAAAGFRVVHAGYFNALGALAWLLVFRLLKRNQAGDGSVRILEWLVPFLRRAEAALPPPFGLSVIAVGRKSSVADC